MRKKTKTVHIGNIAVGGDNPVVVQSMTVNPPSKLEQTVSEINDIESSGCELIRIAVPTMKDASYLSMLKKRVHFPLLQIFILTGELLLPLLTTEQMR